MVSRVQGEDTPILLTLVPRLPLDVGWEMGIQGSLTSGVPLGSPNTLLGGITKSPKAERV